MSDDDADWRDMTTIGSDYEVQFDPFSNRWRHRPLGLMMRRESPITGRDMGYMTQGIGEWRSGPAPERK